MPRQSDSQDIGDQGELWFQTQLPRRWVPQKPTRDVGVDFLVVVCDDSVLNGREFRVQVKSSAQLPVTGGAVTIRGIKRSTLWYWFLSPVPLLLVAYDTSVRRGYYGWHHDVFDPARDLAPDSSEQIVAAMPAQLLDENAWTSIRQHLRAYYANLGRSLNTARAAAHLLPTIRSIADSVRYLNSLDHQKMPVPERPVKMEAMIVLLESIKHRDLVAALRAFLKKLEPDSEGARRIAEWISSYAATVTWAIPSFPFLPPGETIPSDFQLKFAKGRNHEVRPKLIESALDMIMLLAASEEAEEPNQ